MSECIKVNVLKQISLSGTEDCGINYTPNGIEHPTNYDHYFLIMWMCVYACYTSLRIAHREQNTCCGHS